MKILIIGLGSMGSRRIRNLQALKKRDIYGYDADKNARQRAGTKYGIKVIADLKAASHLRFSFVVIATPPQNHLRFVKICLERRWPFFCEFNLLTKDTAVIARESKKRKILGIPSNTEEYDSDIISLLKIIGRPRRGYFTFHLAQNIHDWHPWEKKGKYFIYRPATNALREMLRSELSWMLKLFGPMKSVSASGRSIFTKKYGINDFLSAQLVFKSGVMGELIFDVISPEVIKKFTFVGSRKTVIWDESLNQIVVSRRRRKEKKQLNKKTILPDYKFKENAYLEEMRRVVKMVKANIEPDYTFSDELKLLKWIDKIEQAR